MAINSGPHFDPNGFSEHLRRIEAAWAAKPPADVLELGFGQGYNLAYLAPRHQQVRFHGIHLTPEHLQLAQARQAGFTTDSEVSLDTEVMPNLRRLDRLVGALVRFPWLARRALARRPLARSRNVLTGYLLVPTVAMGLLCYRQLVLHKEG